MLRILLTVVIASVLGFVLGKVQSAALTNNVEEVFEGARVTQAEKSGEYKPQPTGGTPKAEIVGGAEYDFGTMLHGETMSHEFTVRNVGDAPLQLERAGSTCKCTVGDMEKNVLQPGEETVVRLTWTAQSILPAYGQTATFRTNDPQKSELKFGVTGQIAGSFVIEPAELDLGDVPVTEPTEKSFYVFCYLPDSKELTGFRWTNTNTQDYVSIYNEPVPVEETPYERHRTAVVAHKVVVTLDKGLPLGPLSSRIQFQTDLADNVGTLELPVTGRVTSDISLVGGASFNSKLSLLTLGNVKSEEGASVGVFLAVQGQDQDQIEPRIESWEPADAMNVTLGEPKISGKRKLYPIQVEVPKGAPEAYYPGNSSETYGKIVIRTNHETIREIPIFVRLVVIK